jgi:UPF0716 protein FxsA
VPLLVLLFVVVPIAELAVILQVGSWLGFWPTLALLVADSILGAVLLKSQGRGAWQRFQAALAQRRAPAQEVLDGAIVVFGGALLLTPGFLTDALGLACLLPPSRAVLRRVVLRRFTLVAFAGSALRRRGRPSDDDVEGSATDADPPTLR